MDVAANGASAVRVSAARPSAPGIPMVRWDRPGLSDPQRDEALRVITPAERARYSAGAGDLFLQGRMLLRTFAASLIHLPPEHLPITAVCEDCGGPHGQPRLPGSRLRLSLAYCSEAVVAAASVDRAVGIDVETVAGADQRLDAIARLTGHRSLARWTRVEAVLKADGRGLRVDPSEVAFHGAFGSVAGSGVRYRLFEPQLDPAIVVSVAVAA